MEEFLVCLGSLFNLRDELKKIAYPEVPHTTILFA